MNSLKVMSFNASFEAMLGKENLKPGRYRIFNQYKYSNKRIYKGKEYDHGNIPNILDIKSALEAEQDYEFFDFIAIQEASCFSNYRLDKKCDKEFVFKDSSILETMNIYTHIEEIDYLVTLYSKKFSKPEIISGKLAPGKPYTILIFRKEKVVFINLHNEYGKGTENMIDILNKSLKDVLGYTFILTGDINDEINKINLNIDNKDILLSEPKTFNTCCYTTDGEKLLDEKETLTRHYDHIYSNKKISDYRSFDILNYKGEIISDHKPIKCNIII
jgi:hypothetical protein